MINCKVKLKLKWAKYCALSAFGADNTNGNCNNIIFTIKNTTVYSNQDDTSKTLKAKRYYLTKGIIKNYNTIINGKNFYHQAIDPDIKRYEEKFFCFKKRPNIINYLSLNSSLIIFCFFSITLSLINQSNQFTLIGFYFLHFLFFKLIHIIFRHSKWLFYYYSIGFPALYIHKFCLKKYENKISYLNNLNDF